MHQATWSAFTDELPKLAEADARLQRRFTRLTKDLQRYGRATGTDHKRIVIPKSVLTEQDLGTLGFQPVGIAVPEAGQARFTSFRHTQNNYHIHDHGDAWTMHRDEYPALDMALKKVFREREPGVKGLGAALKKSVTETGKGLAHIAKEGNPATAYYIKNKLKGGPGLREELEPLLHKKYKKRIARLRPRTEKTGGLPEKPAPRTEVPGLKVPRVATPRLNPEVGAKVPSNPFRGNWQKLATPTERDIALGLLGAAIVGTGIHTLKSTKDNLVNPRPRGVGAGAVARTGQRVLLPWTGRAQPE